MMLPIQVILRDMPNSTAIENHIRTKAEKLNRFYDRISSCRIAVDEPQKHKNQSDYIFTVRIDITVPGKELVVTRKQNKDIYIAIRDAFKAITRQLEEHSKRQKGQIKTHPDVMYGHIARLIHHDGFG